MNKLTLDNENQVFFYGQEFYVLSNFSAFKVNYTGILFDTAEHAYHHAKFEGFPTIQLRILQTLSAHDAFKCAQEHKAFVPIDWASRRIGVMLEILLAKTQQHEYVRRKLLETGNRILIENSWWDDFWGWGPNRDGKNMLGQLWMQVRDSLRAPPTLTP